MRRCYGTKFRASFPYLIYSTPLVSFVSLAPDAAFSGKKHRDAKLVKVKGFFFGQTARISSSVDASAHDYRLVAPFRSEVWKLHEKAGKVRRADRRRIGGWLDALVDGGKLRLHFWHGRRGRSRSNLPLSTQVYIRMDVYQQNRLNLQIVKRFSGSLSFWYHLLFFAYRSNRTTRSTINSVDKLTFLCVHTCRILSKWILFHQTKFVSVFSPVTLWPTPIKNH